MHSFNRVVAAAAMAAAVASAPTVLADDMNADKFVKMCDMDKDGMVSKAEVMKAVEKMFEKHDTKKMGKLDKKQVEQFLAELMKGGGG